MTERCSVLVTCFEPFAGRDRNISQLLCDQLKSLGLANVKFAVLPVTYGQAFEVLDGHIGALRPEAIVMLGEALGSPGLRLERCAHNWIHSDVPDNRGDVILDTEILPGGASCFITSAPLLSLLPSHPHIRVSLSAGSYVCNQVYYQCLEKYSSTHPCLFIHVTDQLELGEQAHWIHSVVKKLTLSE